MQKIFNSLLIVGLLLFCPVVSADGDMIPVPDIVPFFMINDKGDIFISGLAKNLSNNDPFPAIKKREITCTTSEPFCFKNWVMLSFEYRTPILAAFNDECYSDTFRITKRDNNYIVAESKNSIGISYIYIDLVNKTATETISLNSSNEIIKYQILTNRDEVDTEIKSIIKSQKTKK